MSMTLLQALKELRDMACTGTIPFDDLGICASVKMLTGNYSVSKLQQLWKDWKYHSGDDDYPVVGEDHWIDTKNLWEGRDLELRLSLINHMINKLEGNV